MRVQAKADLESRSSFEERVAAAPDSGSPGSPHSEALAAWHAYLGFEVARYRDKTPARVQAIVLVVTAVYFAPQTLFERALSSCFLVPEFWQVWEC